MATSKSARARDTLIPYEAGCDGDSLLFLLSCSARTIHAILKPAEVDADESNAAKCSVSLVFEVCLCGRTEPSEVADVLDSASCAFFRTSSAR